MSGLSRRERILAGLALLAFGIGVPLVIADQQSRPGGSRRSLAVERRAQREVAAQLVSVRAETELLEQRVESAVSGGSPREMVPLLVQAAQSAAKAAELRLTDVKPLAPEDVAGLRRVPVQLSASARFAEAVRFLYELQRRNPGYHVDQLRLLAPGQQGDRVEMELRIVGFVRQETAGFGRQEEEGANGLHS